ncbi:MAG: hypothetical protein A3B38_00875 [Candidatus Levybacteria bacterium RIFCSPLOWO2_01_FULL_36_13]|nr:MAG: hypothetical protein A2684_02115 [Candidatus Levybacteria bacterium RIFCSPHIGHO2_01_FULL_36_15b]OGH35442.1 MAG: hypothetical protein A3B38_00875 [Candidatus Levybacteria bacterium RIFCSPLOWO2_01_FULL_36_13]
MDGQNDMPGAGAPTQDPMQTPPAGTDTPPATPVDDQMPGAGEPAAPVGTPEPMPEPGTGTGEPMPAPQDDQNQGGQGGAGGGMPPGQGM